MGSGFESDSMDYALRVSLISWVNDRADAMLGRSTWVRYSLTVRIFWASVAWLLGVGSASIPLLILDAPQFFTISFLVWLAAWLAIMLGGTALHSRGLMRAALWGVGGFGLLPLALAAAGSV
jgi:hypothetical protein